MIPSTTRVRQWDEFERCQAVPKGPRHQKTMWTGQTRKERQQNETSRQELVRGRKYRENEAPK